MEKIVKEGKVIDKILLDIMTEYRLSKEEFLYSYETKKGTFGKNNYIVSAFIKTDINKEIKRILEELITNLGLDVTIEVTNKDKRPNFRIYSSKDPIIIGKNGNTLKAIETITRQILQNETNLHYKFNMDISDYKERKDKKIEKLAKKLAKEVIKTNTLIEMENMTSYERRIVHNALTDFQGISTESVGEEPNRHVVIKPI